MKFTELHRIIRENGWHPIPDRGKGSHVRYEKEGNRYTVPFHQGKEIPNWFANKILGQMGIEHEY